MQERQSSGRPSSARNGGTGGSPAPDGTESGPKRKVRGPKKRGRGRAWIWLFFVALFGVVCAVVAYLLVILNGERILSQNINKLNLNEASIIVDKNDKQVAKLYVTEGDGNREFVAIGDIPDLVKKTFVATEDKRFYEHSGVDMIGIGRALVKDVIHRSAKEGASTITQQVARNLFLNSDKTLFRKGTEASIALALERHKSKDEILELYLNRIYFGSGQYGIKTAAKYYFGVNDLKQLEPWQVATLASLPKAPTTYNPIRNPDNSKQRRAVVLTLMQEQGIITASERQAQAQIEYDPSVVPKKNQQFKSYVDYVVEEAKDRTGLSEEELLSGGFTIKTTIDTKAQKIMEDTFKNDKMFEKSKDDIQIEGSMVIMDQHDGSLIAMVGGRDYETKGWNRVTKARQPGSSFKPIASYGPAIETGNYFPWSILRDDKTCYNKGKYCPADSNSKKYIGPVPMTQAIKESRNQPAVWLLNEIGVTKGLSFADKLGFQLDKKKDRNLSIALGGLTNGVSPLEMARAYGAFANGGTLEDAHSILSVTNNKGESVYEFSAPKAKQVMSPETAYYVTQIMQGVTQPGGTGTRAKISGRPVAGKTGTTQHGIKGLTSGGNRDVWFVGYTPEWTAAIWMGYDTTNKDHLVRQSSGQAATMFSAVMSKALEGKKKQSFPKPDGVTDKKPVTAVTGLSAVYSPDTVSVSLNWSGVENAAGYRVYRKGETDSDFTMLAETATTGLEDFQILPDQTFTYYVTSYDAATKQEGEPSDQVSVTITSAAPVTPSPSPPDSPSPSPTDSGGGGGQGDGGGGSPPPSPTDSGTPSPSPSPSDSPPPSDSPSPSPSPSASPATASVSPRPSPSTKTASTPETDEPADPPSASPSGSASSTP
jgi:penicillin-binding protein 2A